MEGRHYLLHRMGPARFGRGGCYVQPLCVPSVSGALYLSLTATHTTHDALNRSYERCVLHCAHPCSPGISKVSVLARDREAGNAAHGFHDDTVMALAIANKFAHNMNSSFGGAMPIVKGWEDG